MSGIFGYLSGSIDNALNTFVITVSSQVSAGIAPLVGAGISIWIMIYGYAVMRHEVSDPINVFVGKAIKISLILGCSMAGGIYQSQIVGAIQSVQDGLVSMVQASSPKMIVSTSGSNIWEVMDSFDDKGTEMAMVILGRGVSSLPMGGWLDLLTGVIVLAANTVFLLVTGGFMLLAKVASAMILALGPMFIASLAFPATQRFFDAWFSKIMNYILLTVLLAIVISISMVICDLYMQKALDSANQSAGSQIGDAFDLVLLYGALLVIILQVPHLASGLAGGASLSGGGAGQFIAGMMLGRRGSDGGDKGGAGGGAIEGSGKGGGQGNGGNGNGDGGGSGNSGGSGRVPAYKRAAQRKFGSRK